MIIEEDDKTNFSRGHRLDQGENEMPAKIIVSYDGTANEDDAVALGRLLGQAGAEVSLAYVRPHRATRSATRRGSSTAA